MITFEQYLIKEKPYSFYNKCNKMDAQEVQLYSEQDDLNYPEETSFHPPNFHINKQEFDKYVKDQFRPKNKNIDYFYNPNENVYFIYDIDKGIHWFYK